MSSNKPLPYRLLWTWDHSTNWDPAQPGGQEEGCGNPYTKPAEAFLSDYTRLIDCMADLDLNGLIVWGFLRDAHGGVQAAQRLCDYARRKNVRILPGVGVMAYGGFYYQGDHEFSMAKWIERYPEMSAVDENGQPYNWTAFPPDGPHMQVLCPSRSANVEWNLNGLRWLIDNFDIGGINYETGDYAVCHCDLCRDKKAGVNVLSPGKPADKINVSFDTMAHVYPLLMDQAHTLKPDLWQVYSTYCGYRSDMAQAVRRFLDPIPQYAICQWTLTHMLDDDHDFPWEDDLLFPARHNVGFFHQGSQWFAALGGKGPFGRYDPVIETIQKAAAKGSRAGLEGLVTHGEVAADHPAWTQNYRAFSHFTHHPGRRVEDLEATGQ